MCYVFFFLLELCEPEDEYVLIAGGVIFSEIFTWGVCCDCRPLCRAAGRGAGGSGRARSADPAQGANFRSPYRHGRNESFSQRFQETPKSQPGATNTRRLRHRTKKATYTKEGKKEGRKETRQNQDKTRKKKEKERKQKKDKEKEKQKKKEKERKQKKEKEKKRENKRKKKDKRQKKKMIKKQTTETKL